jgi:hypothetical protein
MAFGLKNGGATYQKCMNIILENQIGRNVDLKETFDNLCMYKMMLNPKKYVFGVSSGKMLDYKVLSRGIDANPTKVKVIEKLQPPRT